MALVHLVQSMDLRDDRSPFWSFDADRIADKYHGDLGRCALVEVADRNAEMVGRRRVQDRSFREEVNSHDEVHKDPDLASFRCLCSFYDHQGLEEVHFRGRLDPALAKESVFALQMLDSSSLVVLTEKCHCCSSHCVESVH